MSITQTLNQLERLADVEDELTRRLLADLKHMQAAREELEQLEAYQTRIRADRTALIVEAAMCAAEPETRASVTALLELATGGRILQ